MFCSVRFGSTLVAFLPVRPFAFCMCVCTRFCYTMCSIERRCTHIRTRSHTDTHAQRIRIEKSEKKKPNNNNAKLNKYQLAVVVVRVVKCGGSAWCERRDSSVFIQCHFMCVEKFVYIRCVWTVCAMRLAVLCSRETHKVK